MYDIIGDIHGHADELEQLLQKMGYRKSSGTYAHPDKRKAIFVGDYIDRGPKIREALHIVKNMCDAGEAEAVMGNHEFNALGFHTPDTKNGGYFRKHTPKNIDQHLQTLRAFKHFQSEWDDFLEWFKTLPLYLDLEPFRVVHACWDEENIQWLENNYDGISTEFLREANKKDDKDETDKTPYNVIDETLKGKEQPLPEGITFKDKDGNVRNACRIRWWTAPDQRKTYSDVLMHCPAGVASQEIGGEPFHCYIHNKSVFFGHYWLRGLPGLNNSNAVCLDYSVARDGILVAYRWDGPELSEEGFVF